MKFSVIQAQKKHIKAIEQFLSDLDEMAQWKCDTQTSWIEELIEEGFVFVATSPSGKRVYGVITLDMFAPNEIHSLYVAPKQRGNGIGFALLEKAVQAIRDDGNFSVVNVSTLDLFKAKRFYLKFGFRLANTVKAYDGVQYDLRLKLRGI
jgi:GNAT superfamily N-acetyltransferase